MTTHRARGYQTELKSKVREAWAQGIRNVMPVTATGGGKCLGYGTPVLTYAGRILPVQDLKVGDLLMGPDSKPRRIESLARGREPLWRVRPNKGDPFVVNESHILSLKMTGGHPLTAPDGSMVGPGEVCNVALRDYLTASRTFKHCAKTWRAAVSFRCERKPHLIPPYILGMWLGDGVASGPAITTGDAGVLEALRAYADDEGLQTRIVQEPSNCVTVHLTEAKRSRRAGNGFLRGLQHYGLIGNKHIPHAYKVAGKQARFELLAGLLDSDGYNTGKGFQVTLKSEALLDDLIFLARSLGFSGTKRPVSKTCTNTGAVGTYWNVFLNGPVSEVPCRVPRKQAKARRQKKDVLRTGFSLEPLGEGDYYGFELSGPDRLFLLGDFTVTHNTFITASTIEEESVPTACIAHRNELVQQMSIALAREGIRHNVVGAKSLPGQIIAAHQEELGRSFYDPGSPYFVGSVQTLLRMPDSDPVFARTRRWVTDEGHHLLADNMWGKVIGKFHPDSKGMAPTATPCRADGRGLGRAPLGQGLMDLLIEGPGARQLINQGYLTPYRMIVAPGDLDRTLLGHSADGDLNKKELSAARHRSKLTGNAVDAYLKHAAGKLNVVFDVDVESAIATATAFRARGVPSEVLTGDMDAALRKHRLRQFKNRQILVLVTVDIVTEGFDLPAIEVVQFLRPTDSFSLYAQMFGRALRLMIDRELMEMWEDLSIERRLELIARSAKPTALIIDHVDNWRVHGLPDAPRPWSLAGGSDSSKGKDPDAIPLRHCVNPLCPGGVYERYHVECPHCGTKADPTQRSKPEQVDGDLVELDPAVIQQMLGEVARVDGDVKIPHGVALPVSLAIRKNHYNRQQAQHGLRHAMSIWGGWWSSKGFSDRQIAKRFFLVYGIDTLSAQALGSPDAAALTARITADLNSANVLLPQ